MGWDDPVENLIAKLREIEELLSKAQPDAHGLFASRIRQASILATYVRHGLERRRESANGEDYYDGGSQRKAAR